MSQGATGSRARSAPASAALPRRRSPPRPWRHLEFDTRIVLLSLLAGLPAYGLATYLLWTGTFGPGTRWFATASLLVLWASLTALLRAQLVRPLSALSTVLSGLRAGDFSLRARVRNRQQGPLAAAFHQANQLKNILREQRLGAVEASALLRRVLEEIDVAVFAFDANEELRLLNRAGERLLGEPATELIGMRAGQLNLADALSGPAPRTFEERLPGGRGRWELRRTTIRQDGAPLRLLVLSDLARALREEERQAWKRIIRVLSHEINNSLAPIKSIAGSLRTLLRRTPQQPDLGTELAGGLRVIAGRAESLGRFMAAYARLTRLPAPVLVPAHVEPLVRRSATLETRLSVEVRGGPPARIMADPDQFDQLLINLVRNAADASLESGGGVTVRWRIPDDRSLELLVEDEGPGLEDETNLFVPFFTTKPGGSGIGLALCREIAEGHGGRIVLRNRNPRGAVAVLSLPLAPGPPSTDPRTARARETTAPDHPPRR